LLEYQRARRLGYKAIKRKENATGPESADLNRESVAFHSPQNNKKEDEVRGRSPREGEEGGKRGPKSFSPLN